MLNPSMGELMKKVPNRYALVNIAAKRAREISDVAFEMQEILPEKTIKIALDEIISGDIEVNETV